MDNEIVLETVEEKRFAPSISAVPTEVKVDTQLQSELSSIPDKLAFKIGEVAELAQVKPYVLRYWQSEFEALKPKKSKNNQRIYQKKDVELVLMIKKLLYRDRFSIEGARTALKSLKKDKRKAKAIKGVSDHFELIRDHAEDLLTNIQELKALYK